MAEHNDELQDLHLQLSRFISERGLRMTRQRQAIAEVLLTVTGHVNIDQLYTLVRERYPRIGYATIYRTLKLFTEAGLTSAVQFGDGPTRYEIAINRVHHDHIICTRCGLIVEFEDEEIERRQARICAEKGIRITHHKHEVYGVCEDEASCDSRTQTRFSVGGSVR